MQRRWCSPKGNLALSLALNPDRDFLYCLGFLTSLSLALTIQSFMAQSETAIVLKWPNDVLLDGAKCAGILIEYHEQPCEALILGVGVNVCSAPEAMPYPVTSLRAHGIVCTAQELQSRFIAEFQNLRQELHQSGSESLYQKWSAVAHPVGTALKIRTVKENFCGTYLGLNYNGALRVRLESGAVREVMAADCFIAGND